MSDAANGHPRELLSDYLDDQLGVEERTAVDRHLVACEDCRAELDALRQLARAVGAEAVPPVPSELAARIGRGVDAATIVRFPTRRFVVPATIAATLGAIGLLVALQWREGHLGVPATPAPQEQETDRVLDELKRANTPSVPVASENTSKARQVRPEKESTARGALDKDAKLADEPVMRALSKQKKDEGVKGGVEGGIPGGIPGGVVGGVLGGVASGGAVESVGDERRDRGASKVMNQEVAVAPPPAVKSALVTSCADRWSDSGLRGSWGVPDVGAAERQLGRIAHAVGGIGLWRGVAEGRPYVVVVPRDRFEEVFFALRARGVTGLEGPPTLAEGTDCAGISIGLTVVAEPASPSPR